MFFLLLLLRVLFLLMVVLQKLVLFLEFFHLRRILKALLFQLLLMVLERLQLLHFLPSMEMGKFSPQLISPKITEPIVN
jgi:hypothetical protein